MTKSLESEPMQADTAAASEELARHPQPAISDPEPEPTPSASPPVDLETAGRGASMLLLCATIFLSAFLLFQVQPLIGKSILPWFGSSTTTTKGTAWTRANGA